MILATLTLLAQIADTPRRVPFVLSLPEAGLDDSAAYQGYRTRFFRDVRGNTLQIYLDGREGRAVHLFADAEDESIGFSARMPDGRPAALRWGAATAAVIRAARGGSLEYQLVADAPELTVGRFVLGSMRVERDFQYEKRHRAPFADRPFILPELDRLADAVDALDAATRRRHLALLGAADTKQLRARLAPTLSVRSSASEWLARIVQPSLDARDTLVLELRVDPRAVTASRGSDSVTFKAISGRTVPFTVRIATTGRALTPLTRAEIFRPEFLTFLDNARRGTRADGTDSASLRARWLEREARMVELLVSREKLMAGLPNYATYFGRDMLVSTLMMRSIWRDEMSEFAIAAALRKLGAHGDVSHEEALGGQTVRESASEYVRLVSESRAAARDGRRTIADSLLSRAGAVLSTRDIVRENYHMIDDEFQLAVLAARWLADPTVSAARKREFLRADAGNGASRLTRLLEELALIARWTAPYAANADATKLVSFPRRDSTSWSSASWRDSGVGYAGGRFAMDVNAIWAPHAIESIGRILAEVRTLGFDFDALARGRADLARETPLARWAHAPASLVAAVERWHGAAHHFLVQIAPKELRARIDARLATMPAEERDYWTRLLTTSRADRDSLTFLALALDEKGQPIGVANTDPSTRLFLGETERANAAPDAATMASVLRDVRLFTRNYPAGLFIDRVGPVVANDAFATPNVWRDFDRDAYHGPRVVWGREVNLFMLGVARRIADVPSGANGAYLAELRASLEKIHAAVQASGFRSELWSYAFIGGRPAPVRYGSGSDVQLWSTTDLAVQFALSRLTR